MVVETKVFFDKVIVRSAPIIGDYAIICNQDGSLRRVSPEPEMPDGIEISYESPEEGDHAGEIIRIMIGSVWHGPMLEWKKDNGWGNAYSNGNYGKNHAAGGTWAQDQRRYPTISAALDHRDYLCSGILMRSNQMREEDAVISLLRSIDN